MEQFYDPPKVNSRIDIHELFDQKIPLRRNPETNEFVAFNQQRDKLGRLISSRQPHKNSDRKLSMKLQLNSKFQARATGMSDRILTADRTVSRIFKVRSVCNFQGPRDHKINLSAGVSKMVRSPSVWQYNSAKIADKIKYRKPHQAEIRARPQTFKSQQVNRQQTKPIYCLSQLKNQKQQDEQQHIFPKHKVQLNPDLPQLQNFHTMRKLQMEISPNFQENHLRFNNLARKSFVLANRIKRELQFN